MLLTSRQNPICKLVRSLHHSKGRREHQLFLAEGRNAVEAAIVAQWPLQKLFCSEDDIEFWARQVDSEIIQPVSPAILDYLCDAQTGAEVLALCALPAPLSTLSESNDGMTLVLDGVSDPGNVGTLIRSADAAGANGVLCAPSSADPFSPKAVRSSAGSVFHVPPIPLECDIIEALQAASTPIVIADASGETSCFEYSWPARCALVLGHETRGVSEAFQNAAAAKVKIPIYGKAESLNVASAGAILLYVWRTATPAKGR